MLGAGVRDAAQPDREAGRGKAGAGRGGLGPGGAGCEDQPEAQRQTRQAGAEGGTHGESFSLPPWVVIRGQYRRRPAARPSPDAVRAVPKCHNSPVKSLVFLDLNPPPGVDSLKMGRKTPRIRGSKADIRCFPSGFRTYRPM